MTQRSILPSISCPRTPSRGTTRLGFDGQLHEHGTGWQMLGNGHRSFDPILMRFHNPDSHSPFGAGGVNPYAYCANDPVNRSDPSGRIAIRLAATLAVLGGLSMSVGIGLSIAAANAKTLNSAWETAGIVLTFAGTVMMAGGGFLGYRRTIARFDARSSLTGSATTSPPSPPPPYPGRGATPPETPPPPYQAGRFFAPAFPPPPYPFHRRTPPPSPTSSVSSFWPTPPATPPRRNSLTRAPSPPSGHSSPRFGSPATPPHDERRELTPQSSPTASPPMSPPAGEWRSRAGRNRAANGVPPPPETAQMRNKHIRSITVGEF
ncbi:RHS repeat-associated core domain-containing protein [Mesorhizobium retamae]|uniref:RHS repeat-associated core domain-containing protein n=1 Tax=Mesorhizobium retamae TaxID=2912854 RepID=A0ABS9QNJ7_9HYPH|nr:RHS repeat-associated core domain-containing protein [Mesorhizobium sp. IRAMC:0171]MCG7508982.1 hypothetical protein [Mesorhizobium sp. IRAMC:0171]